jgi:membrane protein
LSQPIRSAATSHRRGGSIPRIAIDAAKGFASDRCTTLAASIGFYSAFSLAPTLLIVITVAGWFFGETAAHGRLFAQVHDILGNDAAAAMQPSSKMRTVQAKGDWQRCCPSCCWQSAPPRLSVR